MHPDAKETLLSCHIAVKAAVKLSDIRIAIFFLMGQRITNWKRNLEKKDIAQKMMIPTLRAFNTLIKISPIIFTC